MYVDGRRIDANRTLSSGQLLRVHLKPKRFPVAGIDWRASIVHADEQFVVVNKPAGIPVHATVDNRFENLLYQLQEHVGILTRVTQRLDTDVGGLIVIAKTREFQREFNRLLAERKVSKQYRALVHAPLETGRYVHYMERSARSPKTVVSENREGWLHCALSIVRVEAKGDLFELEIDLETGRTHQIRAQLAALGSPIAGDQLYGSSIELPSIRLFCCRLSWSEWSFTLDPSWYDCGPNVRMSIT